MTTIAVLMVFGFGVYVFRNYWWRMITAKRYGTEADATVSRIEREVRRFHGEEYVQYVCYVCFRRQDGLENEARLLNPKKHLRMGSQVRIRYLPERNDCAVM